MVGVSVENNDPNCLAFLFYQMIILAAKYSWLLSLMKPKRQAHRLWIQNPMALSSF